MTKEELEIGEYTYDDAMIEAVRQDGTPRVHVYRFPHYAVVLGRGGKPETEINTRNCKDDGVPVLRRRGGGGTVVLDPGNIIVSLVYPAEGIGGNHAHFTMITAWLIRTLNLLGFRDLIREGVSDISRDGKKLGGSSIHRSRGILYYTTTLCINPDVDRVERYLLHPPSEPSYRKGRPHKEFMDRLIPHAMDNEVRRVAHRLQQELNPSVFAPKSVVRAVYMVT